MQVAANVKAIRMACAPAGKKEGYKMEWFNEAFGKFSEISTGALITVLVLIAAGIVGLILYFRMKKKDKVPGKGQWTTKELTTAALCIAAAFLLSFIKIFSMPMGGSITPASMLPIMAFAYIYGVRKGLIVGLVYSLLQFVQEPIFLTPVQFLLDYVLAFSLLGLAGLAKKTIVPGILYGCGARFVCQFLSGIVFFGMYAPEGMPVWLYSLGYSGAICGVEAAICIAVSVIPAMSKMLNRARKAQLQHVASLKQPLTVTGKTA